MNMKAKKIAAALCAIGFTIINCSAMSASAAFTGSVATATLTNDDTDAAGLISYYSLMISADVRKVKITATTYGTDVMAKIGFTNIKVQHSSNGSTGWVTEKTPTDQTDTDTNYYGLDGFSVDVSGGYYYRVVLDHYAKEQGWFFPSSQSIANTSNVVWVPAN